MTDSLNLTRLPRVSLEQWIIFQAIVETGSFARAGQALYKSQSTISYNINKMQETIGIDLFSMSGRKATLTKAGKIIFERSKKIIMLLSQLEDKIEYISQGNESEFKITADELFPFDLLSMAIKQFHQAMPTTQIQITTAADLVSHQSLIQAGQHCALTRNKINDDSNCLIHLDYYAYSSMDAKVAQHQLITYRNLPLPTNCGSEHIEPRIEVDTLALMMELIANKQGYGWLPEIIAEACHLPLAKVIMDDKEQHFQQPIFVTSITPSTQTKAQTLFIEILQSLCKS